MNCTFYNEYEENKILFANLGKKIYSQRIIVKKKYFHLFQQESLTFLNGKFNKFLKVTFICSLQLRQKKVVKFALNNGNYKFRSKCFQISY